MPIKLAKMKNHDSTKYRIEQKIDHLNIFYGNVKWYNHSEKHFESVVFFFLISIQLPYNTVKQLHFWAFIPGK